MQGFRLKDCQHVNSDVTFLSTPSLPQPDRRAGAQLFRSTPEVQGSSGSFPLQNFRKTTSFFFCLPFFLFFFLSFSPTPLPTTPSTANPIGVCRLKETAPRLAMFIHLTQKKFPAQQLPYPFTSGGV